MTLGLSLAAGPGLVDGTVPADSLRAVLDSVFSSRAYDWTIRPSPSGLLARLWHSLEQWLLHLRTSSPVAFNWFYFGLLVVLALILVHGGWVFYRTIQAARQPYQGGVIALSQEVRDERWYQREAEALARAGRFAEAMQSLFIAQILTMDRRNILRFHPAKTPREYAREARLESDDRREFLALVRSLYRYAFAGEPCGPEDYRGWRLGLMREWHASQA
jgi:hypothetical protein